MPVLPRPKAIITESPEGLTITVVSPKTWAMSLAAVAYVLYLGLVVWGGKVALRHFGHYLVNAVAEGGLRGGGAESLAAAALLLVWLVAWTAFGLFLISSAVWLLVGREVIRVDAAGLARLWQPVPFPRGRRYLAAHIRNLRSAPVPERPPHLLYGFPPWLAAPASVAFDYGSATVYLAALTDEAEGGRIVEAILRRYRHFGPRPRGEAG